MALLVREIQSKRAGLWAKAQDSARWAGGDFPYELLQDVYDQTGGLSFYEIQSSQDPNLVRVAAALHLPKEKDLKNQLEFVTFKTIDVSTATQIGLTVHASEGATRIAEINRLHRDIKGLTGLTALKLARAMCFGQTLALSAEDVGTAIATAIYQGHVSDDCLHKDMLRTLLRERIATVNWAP